jgi:hypothetical protein
MRGAATVGRGVFWVAWPLGKTSAGHPSDLGAHEGRQPWRPAGRSGGRVGSSSGPRLGHGRSRAWRRHQLCFPGWRWPCGGLLAAAAAAAASSIGRLRAWPPPVCELPSWWSDRRLEPTASHYKPAGTRHQGSGGSAAPARLGHIVSSPSASCGRRFSQVAPAPSDR